MHWRAANKYLALTGPQKAGGAGRGRATHQTSTMARKQKKRVARPHPYAAPPVLSRAELGSLAPAELDARKSELDRVIEGLEEQREAVFRQMQKNGPTTAGEACDCEDCAASDCEEVPEDASGSDCVECESEEERAEEGECCGAAPCSSLCYWRTRSRAAKEQ